MMAWRLKKPAQLKVPSLNKMHVAAMKRAVLLVALAVLMALPLVFVNHPIGYIPLVMYVLVLLASWMYLKLITRKLAVENDFQTGSCLRGSSVELPITLKNHSRLPILCARPHVYVKNPYGQVENEVLAIAMVDGGGTDVMNAEVQLGHIGVYTAGLQGVTLYDPLKLFQSYAKAEGQAELVSTPHAAYVDTIEFADLAVHESSTPIRTVLSDNVDYAGTREYAFGDPMKSVHWKLSARFDELQTRLFEASVNTKLAVIMDFHAPAYEAEELMECSDVIVEVALGVMSLAAKRRVEASLCYVDKNGRVMTSDLPGEAEIDRFVAGLPLLSPEVDSECALDIAQRESERFGGSDSVVFCTSALTKELVARAVEMRGGHLSVTIILAVPRGAVRAFYSGNQGIMTELSGAGVVCTVVSDASDLRKAAYDE